MSAHAPNICLICQTTLEEIAPIVKCAFGVLSVSVDDYRFPTYIAARVCLMCGLAVPSEVMNCGTAMVRLLQPAELYRSLLVYPQMVFVPSWRNKGAEGAPSVCCFYEEFRCHEFDAVSEEQSVDDEFVEQFNERMDSMFSEIASSGPPQKK